ncbi:polysaccharide deacetylase family protein [Variovorax sp. VNK109]|uniref:polysaccharide deacetylase family protein n=1 Tax=Variovorax sp. VNK109 TaxID=3400919 RepID=UPI003C05D9D4
MASGHLITRRAEHVPSRAIRRGLTRRGLSCAALAAVLAAWHPGVLAQGEPSGAQCGKPAYLTFDTGHMAIAPLVADVLNRQQVRVTFFGANEKTVVGDGSLGDHWASWWRARAAEGHEFASHTWDHAYWRADINRADGTRFRIRASAGDKAGRDQIWTAAEYCRNIEHAALRLEAITGKKTLPLFRAAGGKTSPALLMAARQCGWQHVGWSPAGFLGDELSSEQYPNSVLLDRALGSIRSGDVLLAHLGIWSRNDPWAPAVLEPLIVGLKAKGFCFRTLREHPQYQDWIAAKAHK